MSTGADLTFATFAPVSRFNPEREVARKAICIVGFEHRPPTNLTVNGQLSKSYHVLNHNKNSNFAGIRTVSNRLAKDLGVSFGLEFETLLTSAPL